MDQTTFTPWQRFWMGVVGVVGAYFVWTAASSFLFPVSSLTVVGEGHVNAKPETVSMIVTRVNSARDATSSINEGDAGIKVLIDTAKSVAGSDATIQQSFYQINPVPTQQVVGGQVVSVTVYQLANAFSLKTNQVDKTNELVKSLYNDGATTVSNISFATTDQEKTEQQARLLAVKDAHDKAAQIAKSAGKRLGRLISIQDDNQTASSTVGNSGSSSSQQTLDTIDITKQVSVLYEIW